MSQYVQQMEKYLKWLAIQEAEMLYSMYEKLWDITWHIIVRLLSSSKQFISIKNDDSSKRIYIYGVKTNIQYNPCFYKMMNIHYKQLKYTSLIWLHGMWSSRDESFPDIFQLAQHTISLELFHLQKKNLHYFMSFWLYCPISQLWSRSYLIIKSGWHIGNMIWLENLHAYPLSF